MIQMFFFSNLTCRPCSVDDVDGMGAKMEHNDMTCGRILVHAIVKT
jgi:hypothetical protein